MERDLKFGKVLQFVLFWGKVKRKRERQRERERERERPDIDN